MASVCLGIDHSLRDLYDDLAGGASIPHCSVRICRRIEGEAARIQERHHMATFREPRGLAQDVALMRSALARQHGQQGEDS